MSESARKLIETLNKNAHELRWYCFEKFNDKRNWSTQLIPVETVTALLTKFFQEQEQAKVSVDRKQLENIRDYIEAHQERIGFYGKGVYDLTIWLLGNLPLEVFYAEHVENKELLAGSVEEGSK